MKENIKNLNLLISYWLLITTVLVALIIIVGGLTRLTDSGLSITRWDLFSGILPPLTQADWINYFELYKKIPEFQLINFNMTLDQFKVIFLWEYAHRLLGRVIGLFYFIPLVIFSFLRCLNKKYIFNYYLILFLIVLQGVVGWYMVKSGLSERTDVSHYRLSLHLTLAFVIFAFLFWNYLKLTKERTKINVDKFISRIIKLFFLLIIFQISLGALVSGGLSNYWGLQIDGNISDDIVHLNHNVRRKIKKSFVDIFKKFSFLGEANINNKVYKNSYNTNLFPEKIIKNNKTFDFSKPIIAYRKKNIYKKKKY